MSEESRAPRVVGVWELLVRCSVCMVNRKKKTELGKREFEKSQPVYLGGESGGHPSERTC